MAIDKWNTIAPVYSLIRKNPISAGLQKKEYSKIRNLLLQIDKQQIKKVCDVGCGYGASTDLFCFPGVSVIATDQNKSFLLQAKSQRYGAFFLQSTIPCLPFHSKSFNLVTCIGVIEYINQPDKLLSELHRIMTPDGYLLITNTPKNLINYIRFFFGIRLYPRASKNLKASFAGCNFRIIASDKIFSQEQYLLRKS